MAQHLELTSREFDRLAGAGDAPAVHIDAHVSELKYSAIRPAILAGAPPQRFDARQQFGDFERFGKIVVRSDAQTRHPVRDIAARCQHQNGSVDAAASEFRTKLEAAPVRK